MRKEFKKYSEGWNFFKDYFLLVQEFAVIDSESKEANEKWWDDFLKAASKLDKYRHDALFVSLIQTFARQKEDEQRNINRQLYAA